MVRASGGTYAFGTQACLITTRGRSHWELSSLGRLEEQRTKSLEGCQAERPWIRNLFEDASRRAHDAMAGEDMRAVKAVEGTTACGNQANDHRKFRRQPLRSEA